MAQGCEQRQTPKDDLPDREAYCLEPVVPIVEALLARTDGAVLGLRWTAHLVDQVDRRIDQFGWKAIEEGSGYGTEEVAILGALAERIDPSQWLDIEPPDLPPSEQIHLEAARTLPFIAQNDQRLVDPLTFLERTPEVYVTDKGLHNALSRLLPSEGSPQRWASELLGWRLLKTVDPAEKLQRTWDVISGVRVHAQRPIHQVANAPGKASSDDPCAHGYDWDRLPQAVFSIGLGALDSTVPLETPAPIPLDLWNALHRFVWERWTTDVQVPNSFWSRAFVALMLRRVRAGNSASMRSLPKANADDIAVAIKPFLGANSAFAALAINMTDNEAERDLLRVAIERNGYSSVELIKRIVALRDVDDRLVPIVGAHTSTLRKLLHGWTTE